MTSHGVWNRHSRLLPFRNHFIFCWLSMSRRFDLNQFDSKIDKNGSDKSRQFFEHGHESKKSVHLPPFFLLSKSRKSTNTGPKCSHRERDRTRQVEWWITQNGETCWKKERGGLYLRHKKTPPNCTVLPRLRLKEVKVCAHWLLLLPPPILLLFLMVLFLDLFTKAVPSKGERKGVKK